EAHRRRSVLHIERHFVVASREEPTHSPALKFGIRLRPHDPGRIVTDLETIIIDERPQFLEGLQGIHLVRQTDLCQGAPTALRAIVQRWWAHTLKAKLARPSHGP